MTPQELKNRVVEALWANDDLDVSHIEVKVLGSDVYLEGAVPTRDMYDLATHLASQVGGVGDLTNNLTTTDEAYDIRDEFDSDIRLLMADQATTAIANEPGEVYEGPFGEQLDEPIMPQEGENGGPVGGDSGEITHPTDLNETAPMAGDMFNADEPWRYADVGPNADLDEEAVLPPDEDEV